MRGDTQRPRSAGPRCAEAAGTRETEGVENSEKCRSRRMRTGLKGNQCCRKGRAAGWRAERGFWLKTTAVRRQVPGGAFRCCETTRASPFFRAAFEAAIVREGSKTPSPEGAFRRSERDTTLTLAKEDQRERDTKLTLTEEEQGQGAPS